MHFNPRIPRGMRLLSSYAVLFIRLFQSTHPSRDATEFQRHKPFRGFISIHASLAGCDRRPGESPSSRPYFNPRIPRGMRHDKRPIIISVCIYFNPRILRGMRRSTTLPILAANSGFQSTHPSRDATSFLLCRFVYQVISIHASLAGCDRLYLWDI